MVNMPNYLIYRPNIIASPEFSPVRVMIAQGFDSPMAFLTERNSSDYLRRNKILWRIKDQVRARVSGEKFGLEVCRTYALVAREKRFATDFSIV